MCPKLVAVGASVALALVGATEARAAAPITWTLNIAEVAVQYKFNSGAQCVPIGPGTQQGKSLRFSAFACSVFLDDGTQEQLAIAPTSTTQTTYRTLHPAVSKAADPGPVPTTARYAQQIILLDAKRGALELVDESVWQLSDPQHLLAGWKQGDRVSIELGATYAVVDLTRHQVVGAVFRGFDR